MERAKRKTLHKRRLINIKIFIEILAVFCFVFCFIAIFKSIKSSISINLHKIKPGHYVKIKGINKWMIVKECKKSTKDFAYLIFIEELNEWAPFEKAEHHAASKMHAMVFYGKFDRFLTKIFEMIGIKE